MRGVDLLVPLVVVGALLVVIGGFVLLVFHKDDPAGRAGALGWAGFGITASSVALGVLFLVGAAIDEPGGADAVGLVAVWLLPLLALCGLAYYRPSLALPVLGAVSVVPIAMGVWASFDFEGWRSWQDEVGPVSVVTVVVLGAALAVLGLSRLAAAGWLMVVLTAVPALLLMVGSGPEHRVPVSLEVVSIPVLLSGLLYLWAGHLERAVVPPRTGIRGQRPAEPVSVG